MKSQHCLSTHAGFTFIAHRYCLYLHLHHSLSPSFFFSLSQFSILNPSVPTVTRIFLHFSFSPFFTFSINQSVSYMFPITISFGSSFIFPKFPNFLFSLSLSLSAASSFLSAPFFFKLVCYLLSLPFSNLSVL